MSIVLSIAINVEGHIFAGTGTKGNGIYRIGEPVKKLSTSVAAATPAVPIAFSLTQNYPNPFNDGA